MTMLDPITEPANDLSLDGFLQSLKAQNTALLICMYGMIRAIDDAHRQEVKEALDFALKKVSEARTPENTNVNYHDALEKSLNRLVKMLESKPGGPSHG